MLKLAKLPIVSELDENFFSNRVINIWNSLPDNIVAYRSIDQALNGALTNWTLTNLMRLRAPFRIGHYCG